MPRKEKECRRIAKELRNYLNNEEQEIINSLKREMHDTASEPVYTVDRMLVFLYSIRYNRLYLEKIF